MRAFLFGSFAAAGFAVLFYFGFSYWREQTQPKSLDSLSILGKMEIQGVPDVKGKTLSGEPVLLSQFNGRIKIINFWASWCAPCLEEFPSLIEVVKKMGTDVVLLAVSQDSEIAEINSFLRMYGDLKTLTNVVLITDFEHENANLFGVERLPESFIVGPDGKLKKKIVGTIDWNTEDAIHYLRSLKH